METKDNFDINQINDPDKELVKAWIGTKYQDFYLQKYYKGDLGFNFSAFLIPDLFFITRKMWIEALVILLIDFLILFLNGGIPYPVALIIRLILGFAYYPLYSANIKRKIAKYKKQGLSYEQHLEVAQKYGGDKITVAVLLVLVVEIAIFVLLGVKLGMDSYNARKNVNSYNSNRYSSQYENNDNYNAYNDYLAQEEEDKRILEESNKLIEEYEKKYNVTNDDSITKVEINEDLDNVAFDSNNKNTENIQYKTKSTSGILSVDNWKMIYDTEKWEEIEVPEEFNTEEGSYQTMLKSKDGILLGYILGQQTKGSIDFSDKATREKIVEKLKEDVGYSLYQSVGKLVDIESEVKKIKDNVYFINLDAQEMGEHVYILKQDNNTFQIYAFTAFKDFKEGFTKDDITSLKRIFATIEFLN